MTNWADALKLIDVNDMPSASYIGKVYNTEIDTFSELLGINDCPWSNEFYDRMLKHWVTSWVCTDTRVGVAVYCLDKVPVAVSTQPARKSREDIMFLSQESMEVVRACVLQYVQPYNVLPVVNTEEEIHPSFFDTSTRQCPFSVL